MCHNPKATLYYLNIEVWSYFSFCRYVKLIHHCLWPMQIVMQNILYVRKSWEQIYTMELSK